jgi:hypothetical protein
VSNTTTCSPAGQAPSSKKSRLEYAFVPLPRIAHNYRKDGLLTSEDLYVLGELIEFRGKDGASCWVTPNTLADRLGLSLATLKRCLRRLRDVKLIRRDRVAKPDPEDRKNMTGGRFRFLWMGESGAALPESSRLTSEPGTGSPVSLDAGSPVTPKYRENLRERELRTTTTSSSRGRENSSSSLSDSEGKTEDASTSKAADTARVIPEQPIQLEADHPRIARAVNLKIFGDQKSAADRLVGLYREFEAKAAARGWPFGWHWIDEAIASAERHNANNPKDQIRTTGWIVNTLGNFLCAGGPTTTSQGSVSPTTLSKELSHDLAFQKATKASIRERKTELDQGGMSDAEVWFAVLHEAKAKAQGEGHHPDTIKSIHRWAAEEFSVSSEGCSFHWYYYMPEPETTNKQAG